MLKDAGISSLNPKALSVCFSLFPQFIHPAARRLANGPARHAPHDGLCPRVPRLRRAHPQRPEGQAGGRAVTRVSGAMMIVIGGLLLVERLAG
ncbi:hypothetical protein ACFYPZ_39430 [Streptomyces sp. NPDC005506]|uniref:hypothetical protein n=1 Tax=unclassified Streptomyces TaxID=2593676 RepID=UPI0036CD2E78